MTSESIADRAKTSSATWTSTSAPRDRRQRALLAHDRFDHVEVGRLLPDAKVVIAARDASVLVRERAHRLQVGRPAVQRIIGPAGSRNARELCLDSQRL